MESLTLECWLHYDDTDHTFPVEISSEKTVGCLKDAIKDKKRVKFHDVDANDLDLYRIPLPDEEIFNDTLTQWKVDRTQRINPRTKLSNLFSDSKWLVIIDASSVGAHFFRHSDIILNCWVRGEDRHNIFSIEISGEKTIALLKDAIKNKSHHVFTARELDLYKVCLPVNEDLDRNLQDFVPEHLLGSTETISSVFPHAPAQNHLHIVVELSFRGEKRVLDEEYEDVQDFVKRAKLPSGIWGIQNLEEEREGLGKYLIDHRHFANTALPSQMSGLPPVSLQYRGFGHFLDIFRGRQDVPGMEKVSSSRIRQFVDDFAETMSLFFVEESNRPRDGLKTLKRILSAHNDRPSFHITAGPTDESDRSYAFIGPHGAACCIAKFNNETIGTTIPYIEMFRSFFKSIKKSMQSFPSVTSCWNIPCLGLNIIGPCITFYAMIHFGKCRVIPLTPALSCIRASGDGDDRKALYNAFTAASVLLALITEEAAQLVVNPRPPIERSRRLPAISSLCDPSGSGSIEFKLWKRFSSSPETRDIRLLYTAKTTDDKDIVVKFAPRYSYELHKFCADRDLAPNVLGFERLPGGYFGIAMEYIENASEMIENKRNPNVGRWATQLRELVAAFHRENLVHGDLRSPNILCEGRNAKIIDFDWGGKEGEACYPHEELHYYLTCGRKNKSDLRITKDDDIRVLGLTLEDVGVVS